MYSKFSNFYRNGDDCDLNFLKKIAGITLKKNESLWIIKLILLRKQISIEKVHRYGKQRYKYAICEKIYHASLG